MTSMQAPRVMGHTNEIDPSSRYCTRCGKAISGRVAWLELDRRDNTYHDREDVPEDQSQGWFPFGVDCARRLVG